MQTTICHFPYFFFKSVHVYHDGGVEKLQAFASTFWDNWPCMVIKKVCGKQRDYQEGFAGDCSLRKGDLWPCIRLWYLCPLFRVQAYTVSHYPHPFRFDIESSNFSKVRQLLCAWILSLSPKVEHSISVTRKKKKISQHCGVKEIKGA